MGDRGSPSLNLILWEVSVNYTWEQIHFLGKVN